MTTIAIVIAIPLVKFLKLLNSGEGLNFKGRIADDDRLRNRNPRSLLKFLKLLHRFLKGLNEGIVDDDL